MSRVCLLLNPAQTKCQRPQIGVQCDYAPTPTRH